jgi:hypothetical protein
MEDRFDIQPEPSAEVIGFLQTKFSIGKSLSPPTVAPVAGVAGLIVSVASVVPGTLSTASCSGLPAHCGRADWCR